MIWSLVVEGYVSTDDATLPVTISYVNIVANLPWDTARK